MKRFPWCQFHYRHNSFGVLVIAGALHTLLLFSLPTAGWADAQEKPTDLTELSLEELMQIDVISIDVLGTHTHLAGEWMLSYSYMFMKMDGNRDRTRRKSVSDVHKDFKVSPTEMSMQMHMPMVMYAPTDDLTLMAMLPIIRLSMDHKTKSGIRFTTKSEGVGDLKVEALYTFYRYRTWQQRFIFHAGLSFPTGSIDEKDDTPLGLNQKLPYPMQLGSGTYDLHPGITYIGQTENWGWAAEFIPTIRPGRNSNGYRLGNRYHLGARLIRKLTDWLSTSLRLDGQIWGNIHGADRDLDRTLAPTADPDRRAGKRVDLLLGFDLYAPKGKLIKGHRLAIEGGLPIYQWLDGPQLESDWRLSVGWQWVY